MDAFDVLGLAPALDLELSALEQRYRDLQRQLHPDKFVNAASSERRESLSRAMAVNEAYRVLKDELKRAELLFTRLTGQKASEGQSTADSELLMEVMELREELSSAKQKRDLALAARLKADVDKRQRATEEALRSAYARLTAGPNHAAQEQAARALSRLRYYRRFQDEAAALEDDFSD